MKLNYTSLQYAVEPVDAVPGRMGPVCVGFLHGQLPPIAFGFAEAARIGYVQTWGGALPGAMSDVVRELQQRGLLAEHLTAGPAYGARDGDAITLAGALTYGFGDLSWDAAICLPGPGILGSGSPLGHGGMAALDSIHTAAALGCPVVVAPRRSSGDPRPRHRGLSHHTRTMLQLALVPLVVATAGEKPEPGVAEHDWRTGAADLDAYAACGLPARTMGRSIEEDPAFFAAALAAGSVLADVIRAS